MRVFSIAIWLTFIGHTLGTCPKATIGQYYQLGDWCYIVRGIETPLSFKDANADCVTLDADGSASLVVVTEQQTQSLLTAMTAYLFQQNAWIGLSQKLFRPFQWVDGTSLIYTNWAPTEPNGFGVIPGIGIDCVEFVSDILHPGRWYDVPCSTKNAYVCQVKAVDATIVPSISECPIGDYINFYTSCFRLYLDPKTFDEAQKTCQKDSAVDSFLATTDIGYENAILEFLLYRQGAGATSAWIGLQKDTVTSQFKWVDDYPVVFTNWGVNQPDSSNTNRACTQIVIDSSSASWDDTTCDTQLPFFCKFRVGGHHPPNVTEPPSTGNCPSGWEQYGSDCYLFQPSDTKTNQNRARYNCYLNYGSQLAVIHSNGQNEFIRKKSVAMEYKSVWIGLERDGNGGFLWEDESPLDYENWVNKQPDVPFLQKCVRLYPDIFGQWKDDVCFLNANIVCMMPQYQDGNAPESTICPTNSDWILKGDYCYMFSEPVENSGYSWQESQEWCNKNAGHLVSIENKAEQDFLNELHFQLFPDFWIGLRETSEPVKYTWSDGSAYSFQFWDEGEPNDANDAEQCVELNMWRGGKWNDVNCGVKQSYICKKPKDAVSSVATPTEKPLTGGCPDGWFQTITKCYKVFGGSSNQKTRTEAAAVCKTYNNGHLAVILNSGEQALLSTLMESDSEALWIGLSNVGSPNGQYQWSDGSSVDYTNWDKGQPENWNDPNIPQTACVRMMDSPHSPGKWSNVYCYIKSAFACTTDSSPDYPYQPLKFETTCSKKGYLSFHGSCFKYDLTKRTYDEAVEFCQADGTSIATIRDGFDDSVSVVLLYVHQLTDAWIGLRKNSFTEVYEWEDRWPYLYTNWAPGQPSWTGDNHGCVSLGMDGFWYDNTCSGTEKHATICKEAQVSPPTTPEPSVNGKCPKDWMPWGSSCYFFETKTVAWDAASYYCQSERSGSLVSIHSSDENAFILEKAQTALSGDYMWIRMRRENNGFLDWANDPLDLVNFANWASQEPNGASSKEDCMQMSLTQNPGKWRDTSCTNTASYLCKRPQTGGTKQPQAGGLSGGSVAGIVIGVILLVAAIGGGIFAFFLLRGRTTGTFSFGKKDTTGIVNDDALQSNS